MTKEELRREKQRARDETIAELWEEGLKGPEIARRVGMSEMSLYMAVKRMREQGRPLTNRKPHLSARFARLRELEQR